MSENKILDPESITGSISFSPATVEFPDYGKYMAQAEQIAAYIRDIDLTEDNVKEAKTTLAAARKVTDGLNRKRIDLKRALLGNYSEFESQIRSLTGVIDEADSDLRGKVRELEEQEREEKEQQIYKIWYQRYPSYTISKFIDCYDVFKRWLQPMHLNKTTSMKACEMSMVHWLEEIERELQTCISMGDEYVAEFLISYDLTTAIARVKAKEEIAQTVSQVTADDSDAEVTAAFYIKGKAYITLTEKLLTENGINYKKR